MKRKLIFLVASLAIAFALIFPTPASRIAKASPDNACGECMRGAAEVEQRCHEIADPNERQACRDFAQNVREKCLGTVCGTP
jgi:hypothetical protein